MLAQITLFAPSAATTHWAAKVSTWPPDQPTRTSARPSAWVWYSAASPTPARRLDRACPVKDCGATMRRSQGESGSSSGSAAMGRPYKCRLSSVCGRVPVSQASRKPAAANISCMRCQRVGARVPSVGPAPLSIRRTLTPCRCRKYESERPPGPAPTMSTSATSPVAAQVAVFSIETGGLAMVGAAFKLLCKRLRWLCRTPSARRRYCGR